MDKFFLALFLMFLASTVFGADGRAQSKPLVWHDLKSVTVEGRGWPDTSDFYRRLPDRAKSKVNESVWGLSANSSGMVARFVTDSDRISVRWTLVDKELDSSNMTATGVSGVDLYIRSKDQWRWRGTGSPKALENEAHLMTWRTGKRHEFALYLPLYNGVSSVEVGLSEGAAFEPAPSRTRNIKPVVFYGSSITQGGAASRPGMAYPAIVGRRLDIQTINLGFSGSGKCEPEVADLLAELDPQVYVIDCVPNMAQADFDGRMRYLLKVLKEHHPTTPVILVERVPGQSAYIESEHPELTEPKNQLLRKIYEDVKSDWDGRLTYVKGDKLFGTDGDGTVDGSHASDVGFARMADIITPVVAKAIAKSEE